MIEQILEQHRQEQHIPGMAFAIVRDDRVVYSKSFGLRDIEHDLPVTPDTVFPIGSCTKAFTSMAVALSQDRGLLSLDDHPRKFLPYFKLFDREADAAVTLRDMLSHRTGLKAYADLSAEPGVLLREEYVRAATSARPVARLATKFQYSNAMYSAAGEIVGKANHSSWERVVESDIFGPLGMKSSVATLRAAASAPDHATGYVYDGRTVHAVPAPRSLDALAPGGAIASSMRDMTRWLRMLSGSGIIGKRRFVSAAAFRELISPQIPINSTLSYALGWATYDWNALRVVEHNGGSQGISALVSFIPERHAAFVLLANASPGWLTTVGNTAKVIWPLLLSEDVHTQNLPETPAIEGERNVSAGAVASGDLLSLDTVLERMVRAAGDLQKIRNHTSVVMHATKRYENQGVVADLTIEQKAPAKRNEVEVWKAAELEIGRLRVYFDGGRGGQETTFGQDQVNDADANESALRENALHPLLQLKKLYANVRMLRDAKVGDDEAWVIELVPAKGGSTLLSVSKGTSLVLQRESEGTTEAFSDYRNIDGEMVAFRREIYDALGETTIAVDDVRFDQPIPDAEFAPKK